jgi:hypothetical protein
MIQLLKPQVVPGRTAGGRRSTRKLKTVAVQIYHKGFQDSVDALTLTNSGPKKVRSIILLYFLIILIFLYFFNNYLFSHFQNRNSSSGRTAAAEIDKNRALSNDFFEKKIRVREEILTFLACDIHSIPGKPSICWKDPVQHQCYPVTEANINLWITLHVSHLQWMFYTSTNNITMYCICRSRNRICIQRTRCQIASTFTRMDQGPDLRVPLVVKTQWPIMAQ